VTTQFESHGEKSRRAMVVEALAERGEGDIITYEELAEILGESDRSICQNVVNKAKSALERLHTKALLAVPNVGYRIVLAREHLDLAKHHQQKSARALRRSRSKVVNVDMSKLTDGERAAVTIATTALGLQLSYMRRNDIRVGRVETAVAVVQTSQQRSEAEIADLQERLARLEGKKSD